VTETATSSVFFSPYNKQPIINDTCARCRVTAVTSSSEKAAFIKQLGADDVIVAEDLSNFHKRLPAAGKADIVVDCVGGPTMNASLRSVMPGGSVVVLGNVENRSFETSALASCASLCLRSLQRVSSAPGIHHLKFDTSLWFRFH
jgi:NADPH:quinone reductase-like Zn-dependent oxidoreductase